jgi:hypothetical protein
MDETTLFKAFVQAFPQHVVWSGVRERAFRLTIEELFPANNMKQPMVDFMLQIAFTSSAEEARRSPSLIQPRGSFPP